MKSTDIPRTNKLPTEELFHIAGELAKYYGEDGVTYERVTRVLLLLSARGYQPLDLFLYEGLELNRDTGLTELVLQWRTIRGNSGIRGG